MIFSVFVQIFYLNLSQNQTKTLKTYKFQLEYDCGDQRPTTLPTLPSFGQNTTFNEAAKHLLR